MGKIKQLTIQGNIVADAEVKDINGKKICFTLAYNDKIKDNEFTEFYNCLIDYSENLYQYLKKGKLVIITGKPTFKPYYDKNNIAKVGINLYVKDLNF